MQSKNNIFSLKIYSNKSKMFAVLKLFWQVQFIQLSMVAIQISMATMQL